MQGDMGTGRVPRVGKQKPKRRIQLRPLQNILFLHPCAEGVHTVYFAARDWYSSFDIREWIFPKKNPGKEKFGHKATGFSGWMRRLS